MQSSRLPNYKIIDRAGKTLAVCANYLAEFMRKSDLFFKNFQKVHAVLEQYGKSLSDRIAAQEFEMAFVLIGHGPIGHELRPPSNPDRDVYFARLVDWIEVARPLTSLTRSFLDEVLRSSTIRSKSCNDYLTTLEAGMSRWKWRGIDCPTPGDIDTALMPWSLPFKSSTEALSATEQLLSFVEFCQKSLTCARRFLSDMLPGKSDLTERFPLSMMQSENMVDIGQKRFLRKPNMFVLITDMRNSVGDPYRAPELKVEVDGVIGNLREEKSAHSQTTYDDCRVVACNSLREIAFCILRLFNFFDVRKSEHGIAGIRMGCARGEMLLDFDGGLKDVLKAAPADTSETTIARAARLMGLDSQRFKTEGKNILDALGEWGKEEDLLFIERSVYEELPGGIREKCRSLSVILLKALGPQECWAMPIHSLKELVNDSPENKGNK